MGWSWMGAAPISTFGCRKKRLRLRHVTGPRGWEADRRRKRSSGSHWGGKHVGGDRVTTPASFVIKRECSGRRLHALEVPGLVSSLAKPGGHRPERAQGKFLIRICCCSGVAV